MRAVHGFIGIKVRLPTDNRPAARDGWRGLEMWGQVDALPKIAPCLATLQKKKSTSGATSRFGRLAISWAGKTLKISCHPSDFET